MILLDTDVCIAAMRGHRRVAARLIQHGGRVHVPFVVAAELRYGVAKLKRLGQPHEAASKRVDALLDTVGGIVMVGEHVLHCYADLRAGLEVTGAVIGPNDLWIAAQAIAEDALLVSGNAREFARVPSLRLENWLGR